MTPTPAAMTIYAFGATCLGAGVYSLLLSLGRTPSGTCTCRTAEAGNALAAIAMGLYYPLAAYREDRAFFVATIPMRTLTAVVFWRLAFLSAAAWEAAGALLTAAALAWSWSRDGAVSWRLKAE